MTHGIVNVVKATGMSSHDVVSQMRRIYNMKKSAMPVRWILWQQAFCLCI